MKRITIQDIADELGISRNTVSKAINNSDGLAPATREKILQKAVEMGYKQFSYVASFSGSGGNSIAPNLASGTPMPGSDTANEFAVFSTRMFMQSNHFAVPMLDSIKKELSLLGYSLNIYKVDQQNLLKHTLPYSFSLEKVCAIICVEMFDRSYDEMVCSLGLPVLFVDGPNKRYGDTLPADQLYMENTSGITTLVYEMLQKGKKKIGFIGNYEHCQSFFERYTAFRTAMLLADVPVDEQFCLKIEQHEIEEKLPELHELPDLFICANDFIAVDVMHVLRKMGKSVPKDILLCGFDDAPESRLITPALTTVHIHTQIMAYTAVHLLLTRMKDPVLDYRTVHTATELIFRNSTKC